MVKINKIVETIHENNEEIRNYGVKNIGVFGSFVRAAQSRKSDIDILVEFNRGEKVFDNYMDLKFYLEKLFRRRVDLVIKEAIKPRIKHQILKEVIYARL
ncbi:MAG: nucleotidyltransferase family protein [Candidatus Omnitrophota bacterium]